MCADEFLPVGQTTHRKKLVETSSSGTVAELVAAWLQPSTESFGILGASTAVIGHVIADASTAQIGHILVDGGTLSDGTVSITTGVTQLSTGLACRLLLIQNDPDNTMDMFVGTSGTQSIQLVPGQSESLPVSNANQIYLRAASSTGTVNWHSIA